MIRLKSCLSIERLGRRPVEEKDGGGYRLTLVPHRHCPLLEQHARVVASTVWFLCSMTPFYCGV
jgi:hypothetical protein